jgi:transcriptional regulator with XRE-family HTH domain
MSSASKGTFGLRLQQAREAAGFKVRGDFADAVGVSTRTIARWEKGKHLPRDAEERIDQLAALLKRDALWLRTGLDPQTALPEVESYLRSHKQPPRVAELLRVLPFEKMGQPHPTVKQLGKWCLLLEMGLSDEAQSPNGDG